MRKILLLLVTMYCGFTSASVRDEIMDTYYQRRVDIAKYKSMYLMDEVLDKAVELCKKFIDLKNASEVWYAEGPLCDPGLWFNLEGNYEVYDGLGDFKRFYQRVERHAAVRRREFKEYAFEKGFYSKSIWDEYRIIKVGLDEGLDEEEGLDDKGGCDENR